MEYISLGSTCAVANYIYSNYNNINRYPFDWCKINIKQLVDVLNNDFYDFDNIEYKKYSSNHNSIIVKNNYNITFAHEIINKYEIDEFKLKLKNRINKFKNIKNPYFIRFENGKQKKYYNEEFNKLINYLDNKYKNYKLKLIVPYDWNVNYNNIHKYDDIFIDWKYSNIFFTPLHI